MKEFEKGSMTPAQKSTMGTAKSGKSTSPLGFMAEGDVKMPFGGNVSQNCGKPLPKTPKY
jgi:hypothetical protein